MSDSYFACVPGAGVVIPSAHSETPHTRPVDRHRQTSRRVGYSVLRGQPYLVQLICHGLVTRFNRQTFEEGVERARRFSLADVEAVINTAEFYRDGNAYFTGVWIQAETSNPSGQTTVLSALAQSENGITIEELARQAGLSSEEVSSALETLSKHDVVKKDDEQWQFTVELMRRWVAQRKNG